MKTILITGARGFIGSRLSEKLKSNDYSIIELSSKNGLVEDYDTFERFHGREIHHVFHLAGKTYVPDSWKNPTDFIKTNVHGTQNVLEFCRKHSLPLTYVSAYVYGTPAKLPIKENDPVQPNNPYALSKHMGETLCEFYSTHFGLNITIARPFNIYGKDQRKPFLIPEILDQVMSNRDIKVKDLTPKRDYLYLDDLIDGLILTMTKSSGFQLYNFGSGYSLSVKDIIDTIQLAANSSLRVESENLPRTNEIYDVYADISKAQTELGWTPKMSFKDGIGKIFENGEERND
jgi:nucleoside-diphosphate-sugar epimerase